MEDNSRVEGWGYSRMEAIKKPYRWAVTSVTVGLF
jgi:hypothetical protein